MPPSTKCPGTLTCRSALVLPAAVIMLAPPGVLNAIVVLFSVRVSYPPTLILEASVEPSVPLLTIVLSPVPLDISVVAYTPLPNLINADPRSVTVFVVSGTPTDAFACVVLTTLPDVLNAPATLCR